MSNEIGRRLSDYEWGSVGRYIAWLEQKLQLVPVEASRVWSFSVKSGGVDGLISRKKVLLAVIIGNKAILTRYAGENRGDLSDDEIVIMRSMYRSLMKYEEKVKDDVDRATELASFIQRALLSSVEKDKEEQNDISF